MTSSNMRLAKSEGDLDLAWTLMIIIIVMRKIRKIY
jgi:hypothetical protein